MLVCCSLAEFSFRLSRAAVIPFVFFSFLGNGRPVVTTLLATHHRVLSSVHGTLLKFYRWNSGFFTLSIHELSPFFPSVYFFYMEGTALGNFFRLHSTVAYRVYFCYFEGVVSALHDGEQVHVVNMKALFILKIASWNGVMLNHKTHPSFSFNFQKKRWLLQRLALFCSRSSYLLLPCCIPFQCLTGDEFS